MDDNLRRYSSSSLRQCCLRINNLSRVGESTASLHRRNALLSRRHFAPCARSEEHTSELQSLMRISYAVFCLKKKILYTSSSLYDDSHYMLNNSQYRTTMY